MLTATPTTDSTCSQHPDLAARAEGLLRENFSFIPSTEFSAVTDDEIQAMFCLAAANDEAAAASSLADEMPAHLAHMCAAPLLSAEQERELFRAMNYMKFRVHALLATLDAADPDANVVEEAERHLHAARQLRDRIVHSNVRLVISIVKKFATSTYSFDELLSDGLETLMQTVEKFDFSRGFRFSTYAYRSIARTAYRRISERQQEASRCASTTPDVMSQVPQENGSRIVSHDHWMELRDLLARLLGELDPRDRYIIAGRYAMQRSGKVRTFQSMADELGISKERVRQLEQRAVLRLRSMAEKMGLPDLLDEGAAISATANGVDRDAKPSTSTGKRRQTKRSARPAAARRASLHQFRKYGLAAV